MRCKTLLKDHFWFHPADIHSVIWNLRGKTYKILICTLNSCEAVRPFGDKQDRKSTQETNDTEWSSWMHVQGLTLILAPQNPVSRGGLWSSPVKTTPASSCLPFEPGTNREIFCIHLTWLTNEQKCHSSPCKNLICVFCLPTNGQQWIFNPARTSSKNLVTLKEGRVSKAGRERWTKSLLVELRITKKIDLLHKMCNWCLILPKIWGRQEHAQRQQGQQCGKAVI